MEAAPGRRGRDMSLLKLGGVCSSDAVSADQTTHPAAAGPADRPTRTARIRARAALLARSASGWIAIVAAWQALASLNLISSFLFPSPLELIEATIELLLDGSLVRHVGASIERVIVGFAIAAIVGVSLGVLLGWSRLISDVLRPVVEALRPIPPIAWTPIAILWFGVGNAPSYFLVFIGAVFPIFVNSFAAVRNVDRNQINAALCLGAGPSLLIRDVLVPASLPVIFPGLRIGLSVGWMCVVAAELIAAQSGLGYMIQQSRVLMQTRYVVSGMVTIGLIGFAMSEAMGIVERRLMPWLPRSAP
jgi:ABC-type nitrate/sulfonate/bicarbonate transport system permease component